MENKMYLIREIYDSLSYEFDENIFEFYCNDIDFMLGARCTGKTTISFIDAIAQASLDSNKKIALCTDADRRYVYSLLVEFCDNLGLEYFKDSHTLTILLPNKSYIQIISPNTARGCRFDYIVADINKLYEHDYNQILAVSKTMNDIKIISGTQTDFFHEYVHNNMPYAILGNDYKTCHILI